MKAYGRKLGSYLDEDGGPPTRITGGRMCGRRAERRIMHHRARRAAAHEIAEQLTVGPDLFVCRNCGALLPESERSPGTDECVYC